MQQCITFGQHSLTHVYFVQVCRQEWAECALRQDPGFNVEIAALSLNSDLLQRARANYDNAQSDDGRRSSVQTGAFARKFNAKGRGMFLSA